MHVNFSLDDLGITIVAPVKDGVKIKLTPLPYRELLKSKKRSKPFVPLYLRLESKKFYKKLKLHALFYC